MEPQPYTATATVDGKKHQCTIKLTIDQYNRFWLGELIETDLVVKSVQAKVKALRKTKLHAGVITVYPKKSSK